MRRNEPKIFTYLKVPMKNCPIATWLYLLCTITYAVIPGLLVLATAGFLDTAIQAFSESKPYDKVYTYVIYILLLVLLSHISKMIAEYLGSIIQLTLSRKIRILMAEQRMRLHYAVIENKEQCDFIERVCEGGADRFYQGFQNVIQMLEYAIRCITLIVIVFAAMPLVAVIIVVMSILLFKLSIECGKTDYDAFKEAVQYRRHAKALQRVLSARDYTEERTLFQYSQDIRNRWCERVQTADQIEMNVLRKNMIHIKLANIISVGISMVITGLLLIPLYLGSLSIGLYLALIKNVMSLVENLTWQLGPMIEEYEVNYRYIMDYDKLQELAKDESCSDSNPSKGKKAQKTISKIRFEHVSFAYPQTSNLILKDFSYTFHIGKSYAIVGINGAGKTTLIKLLLGFYDNYEGNIYIDNQDIRELNQQELRAYFSVVYQDFARYPLSIRDYLNLGLAMEKVSEAGKTGRMIEALKEVGIYEEVCYLPEGLDTQLGKLFDDGSELSGGQWQRLAIARGIISSALVKVLDEPTAAIDPVSEMEIYSIFKKVSKQQLTLIITHRLGATKLTDEILVMAEGRVQESGSFDILMELGGLYSEMFKAQQRWYHHEEE